MTPLEVLNALAEPRLDGATRAFLEAGRAEIAARRDDGELAALCSKASRFVKEKQKLAPTAVELERAERALAGWNPERWSQLDLVRALLLLARPDLAELSGTRAVLEVFRFADVGELVSLYRTLPLLPNPERFLDKAREGARSNMRALFEALVCDSPYVARWFDAPARRQAAIKALFTEAPLWRLWGLDLHVDAELARMALDLADERRSAGRPVQPELWACLGRSSGARGLEALERELAGGGDSRGRAGAALGLARAGELERLRSLVALERDPLVHEVMSAALAGQHDQRVFRVLQTALQGTR